MHEAPKSCPPVETLKMSICNGAEVAKSMPPERQTKGIAQYGMLPSRLMQIRIKVDKTIHIVDTLPGENLSQSFPENKLNKTMQIPIASMITDTKGRGTLESFFKR